MKGKLPKSRPVSVSQKALPNVVRKRLVEGGVICVATIALFTFLSLLTYHLSDPGWTQITSSVDVENAGGRVGAYLADSLYFLLGYSAYALPITLVFLAGIILKESRASSAVNSVVLSFRAFGCLLFFVGICGLLSLNISPNAFDGHFSAGGLIGKAVANGLSRAVNMQGATLLCCAVFLVGMTFATHVSWLKVLEQIGEMSTKIAMLTSRFLVTTLKRMNCWKSSENGEVSKPIPVNRVKPSIVSGRVTKPIITETAVSEAKAFTQSHIESVEPPKIKVVGGLPTLKLLEKGKPGKPMGGYTHQELELLSRQVEQHLRDFGVMADVVAVHPGPVITRFELQLAAGVKVSKLSALSIDLARSLSVKSVRVVEIIPGKTVVGIELPNMNRATVSLSDVLSSDAYQQALSPLSMALGVDIAGHPMIVDLGKMPHLLVAGTTGSGKSVGINAMILSLLFKATPEQVRLIMIDPKMLELSVYDGIPHLLTPVVTDMKEAASALRWCVGEMERRYSLMSALGVRNLAGFNSKLTEAIANGAPLTDPLWKPIQGMATEAPLLESLPYVVVVIDELADMMMVVGKKVEQLIARIAQKARAAGIHLILATQRPSVDVLTGLIKSNIPTRISFQVSSKIDSRTILDRQGAEQLLGHGDMLFLAPGTGAPLRVHGAFVDDKEVHRVADDWRARGRPAYIVEITQSSEGGFEGEDDEESIETSDPLYDQAVAFVIQSRKASVSSVQRRFKIGYNRAARIVEEMERSGLVGPLDGGSRDVLVSAIAEE
jgi:S-DNA-T family DNA segregation ATPase FtsK/SpoIIIE